MGKPVSSHGTGERPAYPTLSECFLTYQKCCQRLINVGDNKTQVMFTSITSYSYSYIQSQSPHNGPAPRPPPPSPPSAFPTSRLRHCLAVAFGRLLNIQTVGPSICLSVSLTVCQLQAEVLTHFCCFTNIVFHFLQPTTAPQLGQHFGQHFRHSVFAGFAQTAGWAAL